MVLIMSSILRKRIRLGSLPQSGKNPRKNVESNACAEKNKKGMNRMHNMEAALGDASAVLSCRLISMKQRFGRDCRRMLA